MYEKILIACEECKGEGIVEAQTDEGPYSRTGMFRCNECNGSGEVFIYVEDNEAEQD